MEWMATVSFLGKLAHYKIIPEYLGVYHAQLHKYEGSPDITPPENITLVKGVRCWNGSYQQQDFLNELGSAIETGLSQDNSSNEQRSEQTGSI